MRVLKNKTENLELKVRHAYEGIYYLRDMKYIIRIIRKIAKQLPRRKNDIDWLQVHIESFLILNSRFYEDLITDLVREVKAYHILPESFRIKVILQNHKSSLSSKYHAEKQHNRNRAAHGSNYQRVGIPEFSNDVLPKPLNYRPTLKPPLFNMAKRNDLVQMWQKDMRECAEDIEKLLNEVISKLNTFEDSPLVEQEESGNWKLRDGLNEEDLFKDLKQLENSYSKTRPMKNMSETEALQTMAVHHKTVEALFDKYYDRPKDVS